MSIITAVRLLIFCFISLSRTIVSGINQKFLLKILNYETHHIW
jgi:hypothetical protein